ncbi:VPLPA-CTERM sorting domain-containing protein [Rhodovulum euryhalinum]|uniref:VPLPA-CTERM sorting domain-containing protein n=1 Tax=Rhodovulum euryhalinum TaxID=35805 RepID=UPI0014048F20|nr:VPLPA-CTERM sorting domain-containing protein [Rhodovulum euryhalinum]
MKSYLGIGALAVLLVAAPVAGSAATYLAEGFIDDEYADAQGDAYADALVVTTPDSAAPDSGDIVDLIGAGAAIAGSISATGDSGFQGTAFSSGATTSVLSVANTGTTQIVVSYVLDWFLDVSALDGGEAWAGLTLAAGTGGASLFSYDPLDKLFERNVVADLNDPFAGGSGSWSFDLALAPSESVALGLLVDASGFADAGFGPLGAFLAFADASVSVVGVRDSAPAPVPLPAALPMLLAGLGGLALLRRRA